MAKLPHMVNRVAISDSQNKGHDCCHTCKLSKTKSQISHHPTQHAKLPGEQVHLDLIDNLVAYNGNHYTCHFIDNTICFHALFTLNSQQQAEIMIIIQSFIHLIRTHWGCNITIFKLDGEKALGSAFYTFCKEEGIEWIESLPHLPEMNSTIECTGQAIITITQSLMNDTKLLKDLWPEAYKATVYILN